MQEQVLEDLKKNLWNPRPILNDETGMTKYLFS